MKNLIEALEIMLTRGDVEHPTFCGHDELHVYPVDMNFSEQQFKRLDKLGFYPNDMDGFVSYKYGSC